MIIGMVPMATGYLQNAPLGRAVIGGLWWPLSSRCCLSPASTRWSITGECPSKKDTCHDEVAQWKRRSCRHDCAVPLLYRLSRLREQSDAAQLLVKTLEDAVPTVAVVHPKPIAATESIVLPGNVVGWYEAPMYARVTGYVKMWYKDYGTRVKAGDILPKSMHRTSMPNMPRSGLILSRSEPGIALCRGHRETLGGLRPNHAVSEQSITVQEQNLKVQAALVKAAEQKVRKHGKRSFASKTIVAPFDGVVTQRNINVGDLVSKEGI